MKGRGRGRQLRVLFDQTAASDAPHCQEYDDMVTHSHGYCELILLNVARVSE